ncbi:MAG: DHHA1 domain-containing protein, partial [Methanomassiliicoccales archaeon]|nr:DHHA1 domain-containing protein [Methanomassiliicoccales archaeon]
ARLYHCDDSKASCSEIVYELLKAAKKTPTRDVALALMFGILTDTGYFKFAKPATLLTFAELMSVGNVPMDEAMNLVETETDISERISVLKGAQRLKYWKVGQYIVATSQGSAFEASVCKSLLNLGADVAFVGSQRGEQFRVSARATQAVVRKGVHLGNMLGQIGTETTNGGGGHPGAAGLTGTGDVEAILNIAAENAVKVLRRMDSSGE